MFFNRCMTVFIVHFNVYYSTPELFIARNVIIVSLVSRSRRREGLERRRVLGDHEDRFAICPRLARSLVSAVFPFVQI